LLTNTQSEDVFDINAYDFGATPEDCAESIYAQFCDHSIAPAFQIKEILDKFGVILADDEMRPTREGALLFKNGKYVILTNKDCTYLQRKNFTKAHETGHFFMKWHRATPNIICSKESIGSPNCNNQKESEANRFAQTFLLPCEPIQLITDDYSYDLSTVSAIASNYGVSLSVAVIRTIPMLKGTWCGVWSEKGIVKWVVKSPSCHQHLLSVGSHIRQGSVAHRCFHNDFRPYKNYFEKVASNVWINDGGNTSVHELTANLRNYNATLSILRFK
jgi:Zn-dependent peptidase ImmA (M78 family)